MQLVLTREEKRRMRRFIRKAADTLAVTSILSLIITLFILCGRFESRYTIEAKVVNIEGYVYTVEDVAGYEWKFEDDRLFPEGTRVKLKMYNSLTDNTRMDDEIVKVKHIK